MTLCSDKKKVQWQLGMDFIQQFQPAALSCHNRIQVSTSPSNTPAQGYSPLKLKALHANYLLLPIFPKLSQMLQGSKCIIESNLVLFKAKFIFVSSAIQYMPFNLLAKGNTLACCIHWIREKNKMVTD